MSKGYYSSTPTLSTPTSFTPTLSTPTLFTPTLSTTTMPSAACMSSATPCANCRRKMQQCNAVTLQQSDRYYAHGKMMRPSSTTFEQFACNTFLNTNQTNRGLICYDNGTLSIALQEFLDKNRESLREEYTNTQNIYYDYLLNPYQYEH